MKDLTPAALLSNTFLVNHKNNNTLDSIAVSLFSNYCETSRLVYNTLDNYINNVNNNNNNNINNKDLTPAALLSNTFLILSLSSAAVAA